MSGLQVMQVGGQGQVTVAYPPIQAQRDPISAAVNSQYADVQSPNGGFYEPFQSWLNTLTQNTFLYLGHGIWVAYTTSSGNVLTLSDTTGTKVTPDASGNIQIAGTANQITVTAGSSVLTLTIPSAFIAPGSIQSTTTITAGTGLTVTTGNATVSAGNIVATLGNITASAGNISATAGSVSAGTTVTAGTGITATTGNIVASTGNITATLGNIGATAGSVSAGTTVTAGTSITATLGNITATNGNLVLSSAGNKLSIHATTAASDSVGTTAAMSGTPGAIATSTTACTTSSIILFSRKTTGGTPGEVSITSQTSGAFTLTSTANETSTFNYLIIN